MKKGIVYGVEMTPIQAMKFAKYKSNNNIAMNTIKKEDRTTLTRNWLWDEIKKSKNE